MLLIFHALIICNYNKHPYKLKLSFFRYKNLTANILQHHSLHKVRCDISNLRNQNENHPCRNRHCFRNPIDFGFTCSWATSECSDEHFRISFESDQWPVIASCWRRSWWSWWNYWGPSNWRCCSCPTCSCSTCCCTTYWRTTSWYATHVLATSKSRENSNWTMQSEGAEKHNSVIMYYAQCS